MAKPIRLRGEAQKNIVKIMDSLCGQFSRWQIWQDFIVMSAISLANAFDGPHREERERQYMDRAARYSAKELDAFGHMLAEVILEIDRNPDQDFLGDLFMALGLGDEWKGQFFTPYSVCRAMAGINYGPDLEKRVAENGWISVNDPACGAGALLIAFANECRRPGHEINFQTSVLFVAQDIDFLAGMMCYIQLSILGCPGYVVIGDSLANPATSVDRRGLLPRGGGSVWYTPMYHRDIWHWRRTFAQVDMAFQGSEKPVQERETSPEPVTAQEPTDEETKWISDPSSGQLAFF